MNQIFQSLGIEAWKPLLTTLLLPPLPLLLLILVGARLMFRRRMLAWCLVLLGCAGIYLGSTRAVAGALTNWLLRPPNALTTAQVAELKRAPRTGIIVLGAGRRLLAPEYGMSTLKPRAMERLRYGIWLSRETALPLGYSGGLGHDAVSGPSEAEVAARIAEREFARPLRWAEDQSRDTQENALRTVALLHPQGIEQIVVVTDDFHMARAMRNFERAAQSMAASASARKMTFIAAPLGRPASSRIRWTDWLPDRDAAQDTWLALHEWLGLIAGA